MKKLVLVLILGIVCLKSNSQPVFGVFSKIGKAELKENGVYRPIKTGESLSETDYILVGENSYVALFHKLSGAPKEIRKAGEYSVKELSVGIKTEPSLMSKYTEFILSANSEETKRNRLSATGAVHRGVTDPINIFLPPAPSNRILGDVLFLKWETRDTHSGMFTIHIDDLMGDELVSFETEKNSLLVNLSDPKIINEQVFIVNIQSKENPNIKSAEYGVQRLANKTKRDEVELELKEVVSETKQSLLDYFILEGFYEQHGLIIEAHAMFEQMLQLEPEFITLKEAYSDFLKRNHIK